MISGTLLGAVTDSAGEFVIRQVPAGEYAVRAVSIIGYIDIQNIYNNKASGPPTYDTRTGMLEENDSIGILPTIGISAEF